jgi:hypothetical protein
MNKSLLSVNQWKCLLVALCLYCAGINLWAVVNWERFTTPGVAGTLHVTLGVPDPDYRLPILTLDPRSPLAQAGAKPGDTLVFDHAGDVKREMAAGEAIGATWYAANQARHVVLTTVAAPDVVRSPREAWLIYVMDRVGIWSSLLLGLLIGFRRAEDSSMRVFALMFISKSLDVNYALPGGAFQSFLTQNADPLLAWVSYVSLTFFALVFPQGESHWRLAWARRLFKLYALLFALITVGTIAENHGLLPASLRGSLSLAASNEFMGIASILAALTAFWLSWRRATGGTRQRLAWVGICVGAFYATILVYSANQLLGTPIALEASYPYLTGVRPLAYVALGYALLRYRLFDFGFVINRALVVTIISGLLLVAFGVTEFAVDKLLHFEGREKNIIFDAAVALCIILCFHRIQHWVNHQVNHIFFQQWHKAAEKLRQFLARTAQVTESKALQAKYALALGEFSGAGGVAIFLDGADGSMALCHATLANAPAVIDANHDVVIDLRHTRQLVRLDDGARELPGELALPMMTNGRLRGLVLMDGKLNRQQYRPDELALLAGAVQQLGMDLESLRAAELERELAALETTATQLEGSLATAQQQSSTLEQAYLALERETVLLRRLVQGDSTAAA